LDKNASITYKANSGVANPKMEIATTKSQEKNSLLRQKNQNKGKITIQKCFTKTRIIDPELGLRRTLA